MMKLSDEFKTARQNFLEAVTNNEPAEKQGELYEKMLNAILDEAKKSAREEVDGLVAVSPFDEKLSLREREFFNNLDKKAPEKIEKFFPQETVDRIFEDMVQEHPLLEHIGLRNGGPRLKFLSSTTTGVAVWGKINDEIKGQLTAGFGEEEAIQNKLTAFVVLPKDTEKFGPGWLHSFVSAQLTEAFAVALEAAFLNGDGDEKPIGLSRTLTGTVAAGKTTYNAKTSSGDVTLGAKGKTTEEKANITINEFKEIYKYHSTKANGKPVVTRGNMVIVVNTSDELDFTTQFTTLNGLGVFVTNLPFNPIVIPSIAQEAGKITTFVKGRYDAVIGGGIEFDTFDQTLAFDDLNLYTGKQFAYGKPHDEKTAAVWTLKLGKD